MRIPLRTACGLLLAALLCSVGVTAHAQFRASIQGTVSDPSGAAIPGATVTLQDKDNNHTSTITSNADGLYTFNALPPDHFKITATTKGFETRVLDNVTLIPEQANTVNIQMAISGQQEAVTVNAQAVPNLDTATATISGTLTSNQITHMPSFGRDVFTLAELAPGVFGDQAQNGGGGVRSIPGANQAGSQGADGIMKTENQPQVVANGIQPSNNNVLIDGISTSSVTWGGASVITPSEESVDNVKVSANVYDAEFGRFTGTNIQVTSKSGTNQIHGSVFFTAQRPGLNAYQRWNGPNSVGAAAFDSTGKLKTPQLRGLNRDNQRLNQLGASAGFPIWRDKLFGFFAWEGLRSGSTGFGSGLFETDAFRKAAPSGSIAAQYLSAPGEAPLSIGLMPMDCQTNLGIPDGPYCHLIPNQGFDVGSPLTTPLGTQDTSRSLTSINQPGVGNGLDGVADLALYATQTQSAVNANQYNGRLDAQVTSKDRLSFMVYWQPVTTNSINGPARAIDKWTQTRTNNAFTGLWNHVFNPSLLNEARGNAAGWRWNEISSNPNIRFGLPNLNWGDTHGIWPGSGPSSFASPSGSIFNQWTYGYQDIVTKVYRSQNMKFGFQGTRLLYLNENASASRLSFNFGNIWNFLNDAPYSESGTFNPSTGTPSPNRFDERNNFWGVFFQDDWKVTPALTVNVGIRYDYYGPFYDKDQNLRIVQLGAGSSMLTGLSLRKGGSLYTAQKGDIGPQFGFAWNPRVFAQRFVLRGGFGLNYNQNEMAITSSGGGNPGNTLGLSFCCHTYASTTATGGNIVYADASGDVHNIFGFPANPAAKTTYDANGLPLSGLTSVNAFDPHEKTTQTLHFSLDTEYDLSHGWIATLGYEGSVNHHLLLQEDLNVVAAASGVPLNPHVSRVGYFGNIGNANFHSMLATVKHNFAHGYQLEGQYTWSKSMDNGSQPYYQDTYPYQMAYSYGRSDYNVGNTFRVFGMYQPNFFHNGWLHSLADGWTLTGIENYHTGFPWTPTWNSTLHQFYGGSGQGTLRPAAYLGGAKHDLSNAAFESGPTTVSGHPELSTAYNKDFPNGATSYFVLPTVSNAGGTYAANPVPLPQAPGIARNSFTGPHYSDVDASLTKGFHLPKMPVLGENAVLEFRADAFNLFNQVNLSGPSGNIGTGGGNTGIAFTPNYSFGQSGSALGARIMDLQARFSF